MDSPSQWLPDTWEEADALLGYLNFSSGAPDARFQGALNRLFRQAELARPQDAFRTLGETLRLRLAGLVSGAGPWGDTLQARMVLHVVFDRLLPAYRAFHADLLFHQPDEALFRPYFLARACEAVLRAGGDWENPEGIVQQAIRDLNDFIGHRPVAVLRTPQRIEPYEHEWVCPIPLYLRDGGVACGKYEALVAMALAVLRDTSPEIRQEAWFDPDRLDELSFDPRAFDFDHPANKRPNYMFGCWDPHDVDPRGYYRRFVLQQVTLDTLHARASAARGGAADEALYESAVVLAGTILMASGVSGDGPETHDSSVTLMTLIGHIASYRDAFYQHVLAKQTGKRGERLRAEALRNQQPFGAARQYLNHSLARIRAKQLQHVQLAQVFSRMGNAEAAARQVAAVPVASARILCHVQCARTTALRAFECGDLDSGVGQVRAMRDLLHRGIDCGAIVDPWNVLGFAGNFSLFPAIQNTAPDHRIDILIDVVDQLFALYTRWESAAAVAGRVPLVAAAQEECARLAAWWDQFATTEVSGVRSFSGRQANESAREVAEALSVWRRSGEAGGDVGFWRKHVTGFRSSKAFGLVVEALLAKHDHVASMALLIHWLASADATPLVDGEHSFHELSVRWLRTLWSGAPAGAPTDRWQLTRKFHDFCEANAEQWWRAPRWALGEANALAEADTTLADELEDETGDVYGAAYEEMTYRDSTDDGVEGDMLGGGDVSDDEWEREWRRLQARLAALSGFSAWHKAAVEFVAQAGIPATETNDAFQEWARATTQWENGLRDLLAVVQRQPIRKPLPTEESLLEYDRRRGVKEQALSAISHCLVEAGQAALWIRSAQLPRSEEVGSPLEAWEVAAEEFVRAVLRSDSAEARRAFPQLLARLDEQPILYAPLAKGGDPRRMTAARLFHACINHWLQELPRLGLFSEACQLLETARRMERHRTAAEGVVTEYDRLFETGYVALIEAVVRTEPRSSVPVEADNELIEALQIVSEPLVERWLSHSRRVRLSVLERVSDDRRWRELAAFIQRFGRDLFTQQFFHPGNMRAILHQGVGVWLDGCRDSLGDAEQPELIQAIDQGYDREQAVQMIALVLEAVGENFDVYRDYNSTTTHSDRGDKIYTLLDVLRLKANYDRFEWNLKPVILAHQALIRAGRASAAEIWRRAIAEKTADVSLWHLKRLAERTAEYGLRLATVEDRLEERFVRPLAIDRLRVLIGPAMAELRSSPVSPHFAELESGISEFTDNPSGTGLDVPHWLLELDEEVHRVERDAEQGPAVRGAPPVTLTWTEIESQLRAWVESADPIEEE